MIWRRSYLYKKYSTSKDVCRHGEHTCVKIRVAIAKGIHLFPFRTEKLSPSALMVLPIGGRVSRRPFFSFFKGNNKQIHKNKLTVMWAFFLPIPKLNKVVLATNLWLANRTFTKSQKLGKYSQKESFIGIIMVACYCYRGSCYSIPVSYTHLTLPTIYSV